jgi:hypothetical protein
LGGRSGARLLHIDAYQLAHHILKPVKGKGQRVSGCIGSPTLLQRPSNDVLWVVKPARALLGTHKTWDMPWYVIVCGNRCGPVCGHV